MKEDDFIPICQNNPEPTRGHNSHRQCQHFSSSLYAHLMMRRESLSKETINKIVAERCRPQVLERLLQLPLNVEVPRPVDDVGGRAVNCSFQMMDSGSNLASTRSTVSPMIVSRQMGVYLQAARRLQFQAGLQLLLKPVSRGLANLLVPCSFCRKK